MTVCSHASVGLCEINAGNGIELTAMLIYIFTAFCEPIQVGYECKITTET